MAWGFLALTVILAAWMWVSGLLNPAALVILFLGILGGWFYSMAPVQLERRGWGELDNALIGAFLMPLMGYVLQVGRVTMQAVLALIPVFFIVMVGLLGVHWADRQADVMVGKRSLAVVAGKRAPLLHRTLLVLSYLTALALVGPILPLPVLAASFTTLPVGIWAALTLTRQASPAPSSLAMMAYLLATAFGWIWVGV